MDVLEKLHQHKRKTITRSELAQILGLSEDRLLFEQIQQLEQQDILHPILSSGSNGNVKYLLYSKYKITLPVDTFEKELHEIALLHPLLQATGFLHQNPASYRKFRQPLQLLDRYLFSTHSFPCSISRKERSFAIFSEEKQLDDSSFCKLLEKLGFGPGSLAFYDTPEYCFNDYIPHHKSNMTLLICENKDIWFNIRRRMFEDQARQIWDMKIDGVVYGCGNKISEKSALTSYTAFLGGADIQYLYWGDIDRAGLNIFLSLCRNNPALHISLFLPAYCAMLRAARNRSMPDSTDFRNLLNDYSAIYEKFPSDLHAQLENSILENKRIPQEIISYETLLEIMR